MSINTPSPTLGRRQWRYPPKPNRRSGLVNCVLLTSMVFVLGFCGVMLLLRSLATDPNGKVCERCVNKVMPEYESLSSDRCHQVCTTEDCIRTAADMIRTMDTSIDPCTDFYNFACSKYHKVSMGKTRREQFMSDVGEGIVNVIIGIIQDIPKHLPESTPGHAASKIRNLYDSCMSFHSTEEMAIPTSLKYLDYFGIKTWPHLNAGFQFINPDLEEVIARLSLYDVNPFFNFDMPRSSENVLQTNTTESNRSDVANEIKVVAPRSPLFLSPVSNKEKVALSMIDILSYFGMSDELMNATIHDVFVFDEVLDDIIQRSRERFTKCAFNASISCSAYSFDCSNGRNSTMEMWCAAAEKVMDATGFREKYPHFSSIILEDRFYFEDVKDLIDRTSHRTLAHGVALKMLLRNLLMMNYRFRRMDDTSVLVKELFQKFQEDRPFLCFSFVVAHLPGLTGAAFYSMKYRGEIEEEGKEIYEDVQKYLVTLIRNMTWIDRDAKESLENLLWRVKMTLQDYLPYVANAKELDEFYKKLLITDESLLSNMMEIKKFRAASDLLYYDNPRMLSAHRRPKFEFNPSYRTEIIDMDFSSFIYPLIAKARPRYSNLGFFGSFVAHEFSHAVEVFLRDLQNMSSSFESTLREKKKCLIDQYSEYEIDLISEKVNGSFTLHENMADYFSIRPTYQALKGYQEEHGIEKTLPGLHFNTEQLFFISYAQWWCEKNTPETMKLYLNDNHSPGKHRVFGIMKNFEPFAKAFNCPLGSPMNPVKKCYF